MIQHKSPITQPVVRIVDDEANVRESLAFMLRQEGFECETFASAKEFLVNDRPSVPGCLLLDVQMPEMTGLELQQEMIRQGRTLPIVFLSAHGTIDIAVDTMQKGAVAFVEKAADRSRLISAVNKALENEMHKLSIAPADLVAKWKSLTPRERDVALLIAQGLLNRDVGERLGGISIKTVQVHRSEVCRKLDVRGATGISQAVRAITALGEEP